ncbi:hypothetical protein POSPLADRAFT_1063688 [Postia placenta MAD-698-R-SB12]|uniref:Uncharacterized protein n=1 Tax=Postia placenta MAD-698-R-SB12 TaxID=670580 RepID=A0A1X6MH95_9APHY|nr:hypothetical protein POSPLADRAFT_1063688 [Postia placenta MAD-698-R-SB12]OSX55718.1 hypothetical protein POSPLADRAFT_1063688 [Postia placenta MAD-698-R-SB12]
MLDAPAHKPSPPSLATLVDTLALAPRPCPTSLPSPDPTPAALIQLPRMESLQMGKCGSLSPSLSMQSALNKEKEKECS